jgi:type I restriction enzyme S subunit
MKLQELCELIVDCEHKTAPTQEAGYPSIRTPNIGRGYFILDGVNRVSEETYRLWTRRAVPQPGDLIMAREAPVGNVAIIPPLLQPCLGQRTLLIRPDRSKVDPSFLNYFLNAPHVQGLIQAKTNGVTVAHLNMEDVRTMELPELPPLTTQRRTGEILSAYDDLIENNTRRIKILEEMAQKIYREWFVDFRFPGHEKVNLTKSSLVSIPEGWEIRHLGEIVTTITKGTTPTTLGRDFQQTGINFIKVESISESGVISLGKVAKIDHETHELLKRSQLKENDILFSIAGAIGRTALVTERLLPANTNQALAIIRCADPYLVPYVFWTIQASEFQHFSLGRVVQTAQANVSLSILKSIPIIVPAMHIVEQFNQTLVPILNLVDVLIRKNDILRKVRGFLLPKLISGEVSVEYHEAEAASQVS